jgi:hypothetical protein
VDDRRQLIQVADEHELNAPNGVPGLGPNRISAAAT